MISRTNHLRGANAEIDALTFGFPCLYFLHLSRLKKVDKPQIGRGYRSLERNPVVDSNQHPVASEKDLSILDLFSQAPDFLFVRGSADIEVEDGLEGGVEEGGSEGGRRREF